MALGIGCLGLNPESSIYLLCNSFNLLNLSVPQFLHLESGGDGRTRFSGLLCLWIVENQLLKPGRGQGPWLSAL